MSSPENKFLTTGEAAQLLGISRSSISRKFDLGLLQGSVNPITGERMVSVSSIHSFMRDHGLQPAGETREVLILTVSSSPELGASLAGLSGNGVNINVQHAAFATDALMMCPARKPSLLICDGTVTDLPAGELIRSLRRNLGSSEMPILALWHGHQRFGQGLPGVSGVVLEGGAGDEGRIRSAVIAILGLNPQSSVEQGAMHRRRWTRFQLDEPVRLGFYHTRNPTRHYWGTGTLRDISRGGACVSDIRLTPGIEFTGEPFRMTLEGQRGRLSGLRAECRIVRLISDHHLHAGVQFVRLTKHHIEQIAQLAQPAA